eukprot:3378980-Rhodomonas_salina.1
MATLQGGIEMTTDGRVSATVPTAENSAQRMQLWGSNLYYTCTKLLAPSILFLIDVLLIVIVSAGVGVAKNGKAKPWETSRLEKGKAYEPWNLAVYRIGEHNFLEEGIDAFANHEKWRGGMSNQSIAANIRVLTQNDLQMGTNTVFEKCLKDEGYLFSNSLKSSAESKHTGQIKKFAWMCAEKSELPLKIWHFATLNILHLVLIWCVASLAARAFSNYGMTPVQGNEAKHNVSVVGAVAASLA